MTDKEWTAIASRPRSINGRSGDLRWTALKDAQITIADAHAMAAAGELIIANRHYQDAVELVVRPAGRASAMVKMAAD